MAKNLRPSILDEMGLSKAIEFYLNDFVATNKIIVLIHSILSKEDLIYT